MPIMDVRMRERNIYIALLFLVLIGGGYFFYFNRQIQQLETELVGFLVPPIEYRGTSYQIDEGEVHGTLLPHEELRVLKLARYTLLARLDPLFGFPGMDLTAYERALDELQHSREDLADYFEVGESQEPILYQTIYPLEFLRSVETLESLRRELVGAPSEDSARRYHAALLMTIDVYQTYIENYLSILDDSTEIGFHEPQTRFHTGYSNATYFSQVLRVYADAAEAAKDEAHKRRACQQLLRVTSSCMSPQYPEEFVAGEAGERLEVSETIAQNVALTRTYREAVYQGTTTNPALVALENSQCFFEQQPVYYHLWWHKAPNGSLVFRPDMINELYVYDFKTGKQSSWNFSKEYISRGGPQYIFQPVANHYVCPDLASDMMTLLSIADVYEKGVLEGGEMMREHEVLAHLDALAADLRSGALSGEEVHAAEELLVTYAHKTTGFPEAIMNVVLSNRVPREYGLYGTDTPLSEFMYLRSVPKLMLAGFNPSVLPVDVSFIEVPAHAYPEHLIPLSHLQTEYTTEELSEFFTGAVQTEYEMLRDVDYIYLKTKE